MKHFPLKGTVSVFGAALISMGLVTLISIGLATADTSAISGPEMGENTWVQLAQGGGDPLKGLLGGSGPSVPCKPCDVPFGGTVNTGGGGGIAPSTQAQIAAACSVTAFRAATTLASFVDGLTTAGWRVPNCLEKLRQVTNRAPDSLTPEELSSLASIDAR